MLYFVVANNLDILSVGSEATFINSKRKGSNLHVSDKESYSDHRHINLSIGDHKLVTETYRNLQRTD